MISRESDPVYPPFAKQAYTVFIPSESDPVLMVNGLEVFSTYGSQSLKTVPPLQVPSLHKASLILPLLVESTVNTVDCFSGHPMSDSVKETKLTTGVRLGTTLSITEVFLSSSSKAVFGSVGVLVFPSLSVAVNFV